MDVDPLHHIWSGKVLLYCGKGDNQMCTAEEKAKMDAASLTLVEKMGAMFEDKINIQ